MTQRSKILFTPGPTNVPEEIRQVLGQDLIHHRMADYHQLLKEINEDVNLITSDKCEFKIGINVISSYIAKGLEFDGVILLEQGKINNLVKYIMCTRALHRLSVIKY